MSKHSTNKDWTFELPSLKYYAHKAGVKITEAPNGTFVLKGGDQVANNVPPDQIKASVDRFIPFVVKQKRRQINKGPNK